MRCLNAIIRPEVEKEMVSGLQEQGVEEIFTQELIGFGRQKGHCELYRGAEYVVDFVPKLMIQIPVPVSKLETLKSKIMEIANNGKIGAGIVWDTSIDLYDVDMPEKRFKSEPIEENPDIKIISAVINTFKLSDIQHDLINIGVMGMSAHEVKDYSDRYSPSSMHEGQEHLVEYIPKFQIMTIVPEDLLDKTLLVIQQAANHPKVGDGKIWVTPLGEITRIRTGEKNDVEKFPQRKSWFRGRNGRSK